MNILFLTKNSWICFAYNDIDFFLWEDTENNTTGIYFLLI